MTRRLALLGPTALVGSCTGAPEMADSSGETGLQGANDAEITGSRCELYTGPVLIERADVTCIDASTARYTVQTVGWTFGGLVFAQQTGASGTQWSDEHDLRSIAFDECGTWDHLERVLDTDAGIDRWAVNSSTVFSCDALETDGTATFAARVYDLDDNFADCLVWGHDPRGLVDGAHDRVNEPTAASELDHCVEATSTR